MFGFWLARLWLFLNRIWWFQSVPFSHSYLLRPKLKPNNTIQNALNLIPKAVNHATTINIGKNQAMISMGPTNNPVLTIDDQGIISRPKNIKDLVDTKEDYVDILSYDTAVVNNTEQYLYDLFFGMAEVENRGRFLRVPKKLFNLLGMYMQRGGYADLTFDEFVNKVE